MAKKSAMAKKSGLDAVRSRGKAALARLCRGDGGESGRSRKSIGFRRVPAGTDDIGARLFDRRKKARNRLSSRGP